MKPWGILPLYPKIYVTTLSVENTKTGEKIRYDKGKPGKPGHEGNDHYHRYNPNAPKGHRGRQVRYLDKDGNPVPEHSEASHLYPPEGESWD